MQIQAYIGNALCGSATVLNRSTGLAFSLLVRPDAAPGCAVSNPTITFRVDGRAMTPQPVWDNSKAQFITLRADDLKVYLPAINR